MVPNGPAHSCFVNWQLELLHWQPSKAKCGCWDKESSFSASVPLRLFQLSTSVNYPAGTFDIELSLVFTRQRCSEEIFLSSSESWRPESFVFHRSEIIIFKGFWGYLGVFMTDRFLDLGLGTNKPFIWVLKDRQRSVWISEPHSSTNMLGD